MDFANWRRSWKLRRAGGRKMVFTLIKTNDQMCIFKFFFVAVIIMVSISCGTTNEKHARRIEFYFIGGEINFPIHQGEKELKGTVKRVIVDEVRLNEIDSIIRTMPKCQECTRYMHSLIGVAYFYEENTMRNKLLYDKFKIKYGNEYYKPKAELINKLFHETADSVVKSSKRGETILPIPR
jgi:hypothetical protein